YNGAGGTISINDGTVTATGGYDGAGIGGGYNGAGGTISINDGTVTATGGYDGAGIGGGYNGAGGTISITGVTVTATGSSGGAGIGGGSKGTGGTISITGGTVTATGGDLGAGIGGGYKGTAGTISITGGTIAAMGSSWGAGIGGGGYGSGGTIDINGGIVTAKGNFGAGIGSGVSVATSATTTINISDGVKKIVASSSRARCIGKGYGAEGSVVVNFISSGNIVTDAAKDAIFYDSGEGGERLIISKNMIRDVLLDDGVKEHISVYPSYVVVGETVTLTLDGAVDPALLKVNDGSSDLVLTDAGNGKWTFVMPESDVTVSARIVPTYSVTLPEQMILHSTSNVADMNGKYQSGTVVSFRARSFWTASNVSDGRNALTPTGGIYSVTVGDADIAIDAEFIRNSNVDLADIGNGFIAIDGDIMTGTTGYTVRISDGASVTLNDATINGGITCNADAVITLVGSNRVTGLGYQAGIKVGLLGKTLTIKGEGSLEATGGTYAAGIGCSFVAYQIDNLTVVNCGNIVIEGGNITAKGGMYAAGIGMSAVAIENGIYYVVGDISIKGGTVNAVAGLGAAGIGVGKIPDEILNSGKKVTAVGKISIYDGIGKVNASSISETVTYMHGETDVSANKDAYFNIVVDGEKQSITPKSEPDYAIAIDKNMMGGTVICRKTARAGDKVVLNPVPARGYTFNSLSVKDEQGHDISGNNGSSTGDYVLIISVTGDEETEKEYSFVMPARNVVVSAEFIPTYEIVFDEGIKNGSVTADVVAPEPGDVVTLTAFPDEGYALAAFSVKDGQGKTVKVNDNTFVMPASKAIVSAVFSPTYNIAIDGNMENGSVTANKTAAMAGEKVTLTATAASGYSLAYFTVKDDAGNDVEVTFDSFKMPEGPVTVSAVFVEGHVVYLDTLSRGYRAKDGDILKGTARCDGGVSHTVKIRSSGLRDTTTVTLWNVSLCGNIVAEGNAAIVLKGSNSVNAEQTNSAAIAIALDRKEFTLVIRGEGSLEAIGSTSNPGIGLESGIGNIEGGNLVIESGTITAKGGYGAAGIGTGIVRSRATLGDISIKGGAVTAIANNGYSNSNSSIQGIGIGEIESGTAQMGKIYLYHGLKVVNAYIKDMMQRYVVYMNGDGSEISGNVEEYFAYEGIGYDFFTKVRSLFNIGIDNNIANGTIAATVASSNGKAYADEVVTLTATPEFGYKVDFYTVKDAAGNNIEVNGNSFVMPLGDVTVSAKFVPKYAAITFSEGGKKATIDGAYGGTDAVEIDEDITVDNVVFNREFLKNTYSTMVLPFSVKTENVSGLNAVLYYNGIGKDANKNDAIRMKVLWAADGVINDDKGIPVHYKDTVMKANTPYLVLMGSETFAVEGPVTIVPTADAVTKYDEWEWEFRGVWKYKKWDTGDRELGYAYGFAASAPENSKIKVGDFVKIGEGTYIYPLRAYLVSSNISETTSPVQGVRANGAYAKRPAVMQKELPELMSVIIDDEGDGKHTTVIGHFNTRTGEFKMNNAATKRTFDVKGRRVNGEKPNARGAYYGKKTTARHPER
ncbi:MAG: hypothetical protein IKS97_01845, partial [Fibrobacter sp.]|nr:hypothetical protein [Fibrobacter sp.]